MRFTESTEKLKSMVARSIKGASNNKLLPITSLMEIKLKDGFLSFVTTDATNYLMIRDAVDGDDFYAVVNAEIFYKLVSKITSEYITVQFDLDSGIFKVMGNGEYKIEVPLDENGEYIQYINPFLPTVNVSDTESISRSTVEVILNTLKPALAVAAQDGVYQYYYVGDSVIATDTCTIANLQVNIFDAPTLISAEMMNLLAVITDENITVAREGKSIQFITDDCIVYGLVMDDIEDYQHDAIMDVINTEFDSLCVLPKIALLQVLDRLALFVSPYDNNAVRFRFNESGLEITSKESSGVETINYIRTEDHKDFTCTVDIQMMTQEIKSIESDMIYLYYGAENALKIVDSNITIVIALIEEDEPPFDY